MSLASVAHQERRCFAYDCMNVEEHHPSLLKIISFPEKRKNRTAENLKCKCVQITN